MLVFFYDILVYNRSWEKHLEQTFGEGKKLRAHKLFAKLSKSGWKELINWVILSPKMELPPIVVK